MKDQYPFSPLTNLQDPTAIWTNRNVQQGVDGSIPSFEAWVYANTEIVNVIRNAGINPSDADLTQLEQAIHAIANAAAAAAFSGIVFPSAPVIPVYTANNGITKTGGTNFSFDIGSLPTSGGVALTDFIAGLVSGSNDKISVQALCNTILSQVQQQSAATASAFAAYRIYTSSTTFTAPAGCTGVEVQCWGAGGGGAYSGPVVAGGGGGGYSAGRYGVNPGATFSVSIGSGGAGGSAGSPVGGTGGTTHLIYSDGVTDMISATGGGGASVNTPGLGGTGYGGQAVYNGQAGGPGANPGSLYFPGTGGAAFASGTNVTTGAVVNGYNYGVGGTGGNSITGPNNGGSGAPGLMIIKAIIL